eukprot:CAMPEP_0197599650 /NCGR_PEP_ID=MMETSP1326-20131121/31819_1 /TAXON_ID=1155430 /ORGANISM="Genus nov. species nov., Strain RCC2288" /LENGTH=56 /DNA_ID=CAMNT_0043166659 /DNA_START=12 /DNA_END=182 /DNA_ORIENTATION=+
MAATAAAAALMSRRMTEFRVVRHERYGDMLRVFDYLEGQLSSMKRRVTEYAAGGVV